MCVLASVIAQYDSAQLSLAEVSLSTVLHYNVLKIYCRVGYIFGAVTFAHSSFISSPLFLGPITDTRS